MAPRRATLYVVPVLPALLALAVLLIAATVWGAVTTARLRTARADSAAAAAAADTAQAAAAEADARAEREAAAAVAAATRADAAEQRARTEQARALDAEARAKLEWDRAASAERRADVAAAEAEQAATEAARAAQRADGAEAALDAARRTLDPEGLWLFERRRLGRLWRDWVSVTLDGTPPVPAAAGIDALRIGVDILAAASREECGVPIDVRWALEPDLVLDTAQVLVVLRAAEELVATARRTSGGDLAVERDDADLVVSLTTEAGQLVASDLLPASTSLGWRVAATDSVLTVRLPGIVATAH